jgi:SAM-dependent methyltransferase
MNEISQQSWFAEWFNSPFYQKLYFENKEGAAEKFIHRLVQHLRPEHASRMLDTACGRGHQSRALASLGFDVTGVDLAPDAIRFASLSKTEKLHFYLHDLRLPFWINYFDYAFNFFTSFGYFRTRREHEDAIRTISGGLRPGGIFMIDYLNVHYTEENLMHDETKKIGNTTFDIHRWDDETHFYKKITVTDPSLTQPLNITEKKAKLLLGDFTDMLSFNSMQVQEVFGDYGLNPYDTKKTPRMIIIARKKGGQKADQEKRLYSDGRTTDALT